MPKCILIEMMNLKEYYKNRIDEYTLLRKTDTRRLLLLSILRLLVFVGGLTVSWILFRHNSYLGAAGILLSVVLFAGLLKAYSKVSLRRDFNSNMITVNSNELSAVTGDISHFNGGNKHIDPAHDFSHDIDLFGTNSLFQYLNRTFSDIGSDTLAGWLKSPFEAAKDFQRRKPAIEELVDHIPWRHKFIATGMINMTSGRENDALFTWFREKPLFACKKGLRILVYLMPGLTIASLFLLIMGWLHYSVFTFLFLTNLLLISLNLGKINRVHEVVSKRFSYLLTIEKLIRHITDEKFNTDYLLEIKNSFYDGNVSAVDRINGLAKIIQAFDSRLNWIVGIGVNGILLWDYHCVIRLEDWKKRISGFVPLWLDSLGRMEALASLSNYACNHPQFIFPEISEGDKFLIAEKLGHQLINADSRVDNDFSISKNGVITIITGANMAGKSTFLRTVAVNLVLAMNGAPVCASRFIFKPVHLFSSMRTTDSLSEHESYFYAELKRLRILIERIRKGEWVFFILDEILKGTNSKDKSEGSRLFIEKILGYGGTGMVATHDISLGALSSKYPDNIVNNCFEIEIEESDISFDYILREGITTKMNAALLMKQHGIID